ncbi:hypothetical protein ACWNXI_07770 [Caldibacillus thermoamylovorans]
MIDEYFQKVNERLELVLSGNLEGADEHNRRWIEQYQERMKPNEVQTALIVDQKHE